MRIHLHASDSAPFSQRSPSSFRSPAPSGAFTPPCRASRHHPTSFHPFGSRPLLPDNAHVYHQIMTCRVARASGHRGIFFIISHFFFSRRSVGGGKKLGELVLHDCHRGLESGEQLELISGLTDEHDVSGDRRASSSLQFRAWGEKCIVMRGSGKKKKGTLTTTQQLCVSKRCLSFYVRSLEGIAIEFPSASEPHRSSRPEESLEASRRLLSFSARPHAPRHRAASWCAGACTQRQRRRQTWPLVQPAAGFRPPWVASRWWWCSPARRLARALP